MPHLPPLCKPDDYKNEVEKKKKNLSRALGGFSIKHLCRISEQEAAESVTDDYDDFGLDAVYYSSAQDTLYLLQSKLRASSEFCQSDALDFCQGVRKIIKQDFSGFNKTIQDRKTEIEGALDQCNSIQLVVAHAGSITPNARQTIVDLISENHGESRLKNEIIDYDLQRITDDLSSDKSYPTVDLSLYLCHYSSANELKPIHLGLVSLSALIEAHRVHGKALYARNIRNFLGSDTEVNLAIQKTLEDGPEDFFFFNNGITAICKSIQPRGSKTVEGKTFRRLEISGLSIVNGAQTISSSSSFADLSEDADVSSAMVLITLIETNGDEDFGNKVTYARNHQNKVSRSNFLALDNKQERLRRNIAYLNIKYAYKSELVNNRYMTITATEAAEALSLFQSDPRYVVWLRTKPSRMTSTDSPQYNQLFSEGLSAHYLVNAVRFSRYINERVDNEIENAEAQEKNVYKYGRYAIGWILSKKLRCLDSNKLFEKADLQARLSIPFDELRQKILEETQASINYSAGPPEVFTKSPAAFFSTQTEVIPFLSKFLTDYFVLSQDPVVAHKQNQQSSDQLYPEDLFNYLISKAPQIENLS